MLAEMSSRRPRLPYELHGCYEFVFHGVNSQAVGGAVRQTRDDLPVDNNVTADDTPEELRVNGMLEAVQVAGPQRNVPFREDGASAQILRSTFWKLSIRDQNHFRK